MRGILAGKKQVLGNTMFSKILAKLGVTRAVRWTLLTQGVRLLTGPATMFLMIRYLTADCQGYAYTFGSVLAISIFLEMGFSQNILQFASHEFASLSFEPNGSLTGDPDSYSRLISLGRLSLKYYGVASILFFTSLMVIGNWFFSTSHDVGISWQGPWLLVSVTSALGLFLNPCWSLLEGCNKIPEVEKFRFYSGVLGFLGLTIGLVCGWGLYAVCMNSLVTTILSLLFLSIRWRHFVSMFLEPSKGPVISWQHEIWPFQWRIAVSWMCGYFIFSIITPTVFRLSSPHAAGQVGFTIQLTRLVASLASSWSTTRLPEFGMLVAKREWAALSKIWRRATIMNVAVTAGGSFAMIVAMEFMVRHVPGLGERYGGWMVAICFSISMVAQAYINSLAFYLRAFKEEPFMWMSILNALLSFILIVMLTWAFQIKGAAIGYMSSILLILPIAWRIYYVKSREYRKIHMNGEACN